MAALIKGSTQEVRMPMTYREGINFRKRIHHLRSRMVEDDHPQKEIASRTRIQLLWGPKAGLPPTEEVRSSKGVRRPLDPEAPSVVVLSPHDSEFDDVLARAGITTDLSDDPLSEFPLKPR